MTANEARQIEQAKIDAAGGCVFCADHDQDGNRLHDITEWVMDEAIEAGQVCADCAEALRV